MDKFSYIANADPEYIENLYENFKSNPESIDAGWKQFFDGFDFAQTGFNKNGLNSDPSNIAGNGTSIGEELKVYNLINAYRSKGHLIANTNPLKPRKDRNAQLGLEQLGFNEDDLGKKFYSGAEIGMENATLQEIIGFLENSYCKSLGYEYTYIIDPIEKKWFRDKIEKEGNSISFSSEQKKRILKKLNDTVVFEQFLDKKYIGQKRFSLEGGETTIPALDAIIN